MNKILVILLIFFLILSTAIIKNSTKRIDDEIFITKENIRGYEKDLEKVKLEHNFLSSTEKLTDFKNSYFDEELEKKNIYEMKIIRKKLGEIKIEELRFFNEK